MKKILCLLLALWSIPTLGCHCSFPILAESYQESEFVALVKISKATPDPKKSTYFNVEIELLNLYKGKAFSAMRVNIMANTSCAFTLPESSTWLVFAKLDQNGIPDFGACSGSQELNEYDPVKYPKASINRKESIELKLLTLDYLKESNLDSFNPNHLTLFPSKDCDLNIKGFENQSRFAIYELDINEDLSIEKITVNREFDNPELAQILLKCLHKNARIYAPGNKETSAKTKMFIIYYYYPAEGNDQSFVSRFDV